MPFVEQMGLATRPELINPRDLANPDFVLPHWINVTYDVSEQMRNRRSTDTQLVQLLLLAVYMGPPIRSLPVTLVSDGVFGDRTKACIKHFQQNLELQQLAQPTRPGLPGPVVPPQPDGFVHRAYGTGTAKIRFTIYRLNRVLAALDHRKFHDLVLKHANLDRFQPF